jgi:DNA-directed RNA polymerase II subunit RPB2
MSVKSVNMSDFDTRPIIELNFGQRDILYIHQHHPFNQFIEAYIPHVMKNENNTFSEIITETEVIKNKFKFDDIYLKPPMIENENEMMFPSDARTRSLTYAALLVATVTQIQERTNIASGEKTEKIIGDIEMEVPVARIPIMVKSKFCSLNIRKDLENTECEYDQGGYFIIKGSEKGVMSFERMVDNKPLVFVKKDQSNKIYTIQINSKNYITDNMQIFSIKLKKDEVMTLKIPHISEIPIFILVRALGIEFDREIIDRVTQGSQDIGLIEMVRVSLDNSVDENGNKIISKESAIEYIITKMKTPRMQYTETDPEIKNQQKRMHLMTLLNRDILPHITGGLAYKAYYICYMVNKILKCYLGKTDPDDRDSFVNKRVDTPGVLVGQLFKQYYKKMFNECNKFFKKRSTDVDNPLNIISQIKPNIIEQGLRTALATGSWGGNKNKKGVAQLLGRLSYLQTISYLRRVSAPTADASTQKLTGPRHVHSSQYGFICPVETPEGHKVGLVKSLSMTGSITLMIPSQITILKKLFEEYIIKLDDVPPIQYSKYIKIFLNGEWLGLNNDPITLINQIKSMRRNGQLERTISVIFDAANKEIRIYCDAGRLFRPLLRVVENELVVNKKIINEINFGEIKKWSHLLTKYPDIVEYVDVEESEYLMIAMYPNDIVKNKTIMNNKNNKNDNHVTDRYNENVYVKYTHCELHPSLMLGAIASTIPFCNHNQSPRNIYQYSQARQAMGIYTSNYRERMDISYVLSHPQTPLIMTLASKYTGSDKMAAGENVVVAIACYSGFNQEDSIIMNQSAIDRGRFRSTAFKKIQETIAKNPTTSRDDVFTKPDKSKVTGMKNANYDKLNEQGYAPEETKITNNDIVIGKISPIQPSGNTNKVYKDSSKVYKSNVNGTVDRVWTGIFDSAGYEMYKMRIREERIPLIGDKFSSRMGQKGTMGISFRQEDMPFTKDGVTPDIIINPNCIPSRMTIAQLIECILGKVSAILGHESDGTPFTDIDVDAIRAQLTDLGFDDSGKEYLYNGINGTKIESMIFIGPTYYQRLKHLVHDKIHSRSRGPYQLLTHQPPEGRSRDGGLRFGEMERDCMIAHGTGQFLKERMVETSDKYGMYVCDKCGFIAQRIKNKDKDVYVCQQCNNNTDISKIQLTYAFKLLMQELMSMNIAPRIRIKKDIYNDI